MQFSGIAYVAGNIVFDVSYVAYLSISVALFLIVNFRYRLPSMLRVLNVLFISIVFYDILFVTSGVVRNSMYFTTESWYQYLSQICESVCTVYALYYFSRQDIFTIKKIKYFSVLLIALCTIQLFLESTNGLEVGERVSNIGYSYLACLPLCLFWRKEHIVRYVLILFCYIMILLAVKRGAIALGTIGVVYALHRSRKNVSPRVHKIVAILSIITLVVGFYILVYVLNNNELFIARLEDTKDGDFSGRGAMYGSMWDYFAYKTELWQFLFGSGCLKSMDIIQLYAHNDWFTVALEMGVFGLVLFVLYFVSMFSSARMLRKNIDSNICDAFVLASLFYFGRTLFSMALFCSGFPYAIVVGYSLATYSKQNEESRLTPVHA